jgi:ubiquitin carboxyl-terminal hydrolase 2/21
MSKIECMKCHHKSLTFDNFMDLSISIPTKSIRITGDVDVNECLQSYVASEKMERCGYECSKCGAIDNMEKDMTIFRFPKILVIHLKRFYQSTMRREKLSTTVIIPPVLDMRPYAPHSNHSSKTNARSYQLYGISHHSGTLNDGHYIGEVMNLDTQKWF